MKLNMMSKTKKVDYLFRKAKCLFRFTVITVPLTSRSKNQKTNIIFFYFYFEEALPRTIGSLFPEEKRFGFYFE